MKVVTPEILWHDREPIYSVDLQPLSGNFQRLASCGVDKIVRIWRIRLDDEGKADVEVLSKLRRHSATVNVCRFSPYGNKLATAGDDATILLWKLSDVHSQANKNFKEEDRENKETWVVYKTLRGHLGGIYDLCWSSDSRYIVSGSVDNSAIAWDTQKDVKLALFNGHKGFVQGVAWDPLREYIATLSSDRSCRIYNLSSKHCTHTVSKIVPRHASSSASEGLAMRIFHDDTLRSFFRRLAFSPDGQLLITPAGLMETSKGQTNATFVFARGAFKEPAAYLPSVNKPSVAVRVCPCLFELRQVPKVNTAGPANEHAREWSKYSTVFNLPYRVVFAVATEDSVVLYDSQQTLPLVFLSNIHYHTLSDLSWSKDGRMLVVSSMDGYCSVVTFDAGELGVPYTPRPASSVSLETRTPNNPKRLKTWTFHLERFSGGLNERFSSQTFGVGFIPTPSSLRTTAIATEEKMDVDMDPKTHHKQHPLGMAAGTSSTRLLPSSLPQARPFTSETCLALEIKNVSIFQHSDSPEKSPATAPKRGVTQPEHQAGLDGAKHSKR